MQELFVPYELAVKLRDLGFDRECFGRYFKIDEEKPIFILNTSPSNENGDIITIAPTWDQAFSWFRTQHQIDIEILLDGGVENPCYRGVVIDRRYQLRINDESVYFSKDIGAYTKYEDIKISLLKELIEICQKK